MTEIRYKKNKDNLELEVKGHCGYAEKGKDIACAGISTLVVTLANALDENSNMLIFQPLLNIQNGYALICAYPKRQKYKRVETIFDTVMQGFRWLSQEFEKNIKIYD